MRGPGNSKNSKYDAIIPGLGQFPASKFFRQKRLLLIPVLGSQYWATAEAAESLIAQIDSKE
jgi:hypothetical protein